jgi:hypothetical protein
MIRNGRGYEVHTYNTAMRMWDAGHGVAHSYVKARRIVRDEVAIRAIRDGLGGSGDDAMWFTEHTHTGSAREIVSAWAAKYGY